MNWEHSLLDGHTMMEFFAPVAAKDNSVRDFLGGSEGGTEAAEAMLATVLPSSQGENGARPPC